MQIGQHAPASHVVAHVSDTHLSASGTVYGSVAAADHLAEVMDRLGQIGPDAIIFTGDIADTAEPEAYDIATSIVVPAAEAMGAELIWVMGNHDARVPFAHHLLGTTVDADVPLDRVVDLQGLRIIALDTTIPGYHDGQVSPAQLEWLREVLSVPAPHGTILAMHHPPISTHLPVMTLIELADQHLLAEAIAGTDVRTILAGHYHYAAHSLLGAIPVSVASSTCYAVDPGADPRGVRGADGSWSFDLVHVRSDQIVHSTVPVTPGPTVIDYPLETLDRVLSMAPAERRELFARSSVEADMFGVVSGV